MRILLAIDGSAYSDLATQEIASRPWPPYIELKIITAVETPVMIGMEPWAASPAYFDQLEKSLRENASAVLDKAVSRLSTVDDKMLKISSEIIPGPPRQVILDEAEKWGAELIVMGSRGLGTWNRLLLGSVSSAVIHHAHCSVEIVRRREKKGPA